MSAKPLDQKALVHEQHIEGKNAAVFDPEERKRIEKKLLWKIDLRMMPILIIICKLLR